MKLDAATADICEYQRGHIALHSVIEAPGVAPMLFGCRERHQTVVENCDRCRSDGLQRSKPRGQRVQSNTLDRPRLSHLYAGD